MPDYQSEHAMKGSLKAREGNFVYQLRLPVTTVGREGSDIILQVRPHSFLLPSILVALFKSILHDF